MKQFMILLLLLGGVATVQADDDPKERFKLPLDFRLRLEQDFDSQDAAGVRRDDRLRLRARFRVGLLYEHDDRWSAGVRLRSGSDQSHQSPHITLLDFNDNDTGEASINFDRWYVQGKSERFWGWAGRNVYPFWEQDEMLLDQDATLVGLAGGWKQGGPQGSWQVNSGYFSLPAGMKRFTGKLGAVQVVYMLPTDRGPTATVALGLFDFDADPSDPDATTLLNGNGARDYSILQLSTQMKVQAGGRPLSVGVDLLTNLEDYSATDPDPFTVANRDQTDGFALLVRYGGLGRSGRWQLGYRYARIETFAINSSYSEYDWVRWGAGGEGRASNLRGHELRVGNELSKQMNLLLRVYIVEAITTVEDGMRARLDWNFTF